MQVATARVEMGVIPYTNAIAAYTRSPSFTMVSGSGIQGLIVVAKPTIKGFQDLRGKKVGTFQADTLDILVYDYLKHHGMTYNDIQIQYLGDTFELTNAFIAGQLDAISVIEPYATKAKTATDGNVLGDGTDIYGQGYPDCTLLAQKDFVAKEGELVKNVIRGHPRRRRRCGNLHRVCRHLLHLDARHLEQHEQRRPGVHQYRAGLGRESPTSPAARDLSGDPAQPLHYRAHEFVRGLDGGIGG
jgi:hypothetical protein